MKNAVGREIPDYLLKDGKEVYQGKNYMDGKYLQKAAPRTRRCEKPVDTKVVSSLAEALKQCGARDGMTFSFHHHLRDGDYVVNLVMAAAIEELGLKDLTSPPPAWAPPTTPSRRISRRARWSASRPPASGERWARWSPPAS